MQVKQSTLTYWGSAFLIQFLVLAWYYGLIGPGGIVPGPNPIDDKIVVSSQEELEVILSALRLVEREWNEKPIAERDASEATMGLSHVFGDGTDGVKQNVQDKIIMEFTGGRDFLESIAYVRSQLVVR